MTSLFERAVGEGWRDLDDPLQERYGFSSDDGVKAVAKGEMTEIRTSLLAHPVLWLLSKDDFLFPCREEDISYTVESHAFEDRRGFEAMYIERRFRTSPRRRFVDTLYWSPERGSVVDFYGCSGRIAAELKFEEDDGELAITLGKQWLRVGGRYVPLPPPFRVSATLRDGFDEESDRYRVEAHVRNPLIGELYVYSGWFRNELQKSSLDGLPEDAVEAEHLP